MPIYRKSAHELKHQYKG